MHDRRARKRHRKAGGTARRVLQRRLSRIMASLSRRFPSASAWPFVLVILAMLGAEQCSNYILAATRAVVTAEGLWSKGQHQATVSLMDYLDTHDPASLVEFRKAITVPLADMAFRDLTEDRPFSYLGAERALTLAKNYKEDIPYIIFLFRRLRGFSYLEEAIAQWKGADSYIVAMSHLADKASRPGADVESVRKELDDINRQVTPRATRFSFVLNQGARFVESLLSWVNDILAVSFAGLSIWRIGRYIGKQNVADDALEWQVTHDDLTGFHNRRAFEDRLEEVHETGEGVVMFLDLDQFKLVNDTAGHPAGDALLKRVCVIVKDALGDDDMVARLGGDEFGIVMPTSDLAGALATAERFRAAVEREVFAWDGRRFAVTTSVGMVVLDGFCSVKEIMARADVACFMAKERGRNRVECYRDDDERMAGRENEMSWVSRVQQALDEDRLCLFAQEIVPLNDEEGTYAEILVRLRDEKGRMVPPGSFLPAAERFGQMGRIDRQVVDKALAAMALTGSHAVRVAKVAVNLSGASLSDQTFLAYVKGRFDRHGVDPSRVCFEITESMAVADMAVAKSFVAGVRTLGCTVSLDDFGAGMSSFRYLKDLGVDVLKVDGSFVRNMLDDVADRGMVEMATKVGHTLGMKVVAEFVETPALAEALRDMGVDYAQGYGVAKPRPFDATFSSVRYVGDEGLRKAA